MRGEAPAAVHDAGRNPPGLPHPFDQLEQRLVAFGQIAVFRMPIIHLRIDIDREFAVPRRVKLSFQMP